MITISQKENNQKTASSSSSSDVAYLCGMKADGTPIKMPQAQWPQASGSAFTEAMAAQVSQAVNDASAAKSQAAALSTTLASNAASLQQQIDARVKTEDIESMLGSFKESEFAYGVEWKITNPNPDVTRIGNPQLHATLPIQSMMRGCLLDDNGKVVKYLASDSWTDETRDGSQGQVMVEIPSFYWKFETDGDTRRVMLSTLPLYGFSAVQKQYVSAYEATVQRSTNKLASVRNTSADYRGGGNSASLDSTYKTQLGLPAVNLSLSAFRTYARNRKSGSKEWNCNTYLIQKTLYWLFVVEYATRNSQKALNTTLTVENYHQGGLGPGVSTVSSAAWSAFNGYYPFVPCGTTDSLGNHTGAVSYNALKEDGSIAFTVSVPRYRGVENPFGHIYKWTDGINVMVQSEADGGESRVYVATDPTMFSDAEAPKDGYTYIGNEPRSNSYIKDVIFGESGEIMALTNGAGETSYFCDYHYVSIPSSDTATRGVLFGGNAYDGASCGFVFSLSYSAPSGTGALIGSRLCFVPA